MDMKTFVEKWKPTDEAIESEFIQDVESLCETERENGWNKAKDNEGCL
jgi:hypothetical protein